MNNKKNTLTLAVLLALAACGGAKTNPDTAVQDAQGLVAQGKTGEARILLKNALAERSSLPGARTLLAELALAEGDAKAASDELSTLDPTTAETPDVLALRARAALALGRPDDAEGFLSRAGERLAEPQRSLLQAQLLRTRANWAEALETLRALQAARPDDAKVAVEISRTLSSMGNYTPALQELDRYIAASKTPSPDALRERADLRMRQGDTAAAIKDLDSALKSAPADWPVVERLGAELMRVQSMIAAGTVDQARSELQRIDKTWPGSLGAVVLWAQIAMFDGRPGEAVDR
ncbi:tetratricopeptide repeat protein, partial [bacterium]